MGNQLLCKKSSSEWNKNTKSASGHTKKTSVSGVAAGCFIKVRMGTFFFIFAKYFLFFQKWTIFSREKKNYEEKKKCGLPTGFKKGHQLDRKQKIF